MRILQQAVLPSECSIAPSNLRHGGSFVQMRGGLFVIVGLIDMVIIVLYPQHALKPSAR